MRQSSSVHIPFADILPKKEILYFLSASDFKKFSLINRHCQTSMQAYLSQPAHYLKENKKYFKNSLVEILHFISNKSATSQKILFLLKRLFMVFHTNLDFSESFLDKKLTNREMYFIAHALKERGNKCAILNLSHTLIEDAVFNVLIRNTPNLKEITLQRCPNISAQNLSNLLIHCSKLENLDLRGMDISRMMIRTIAQHGRYLKDLCLNHVNFKADISAFTDVEVKALVKGCPNLEKLDISGAVDVTDKGLMEVAKHSKQLKVFTFSRAKKITYIGIKSLAENCSKIKGIFLKDSQVKDYHTEALKRIYPHIMFLCHKDGIIDFVRSYTRSV